MSATATASTFKLPDLGEGLTEAELVSWKVDVGDVVTVDQVIAEVETAKAVVEIPTPYAGTVLSLHAAAGETVPVGAPLITVGAAGSPEAPDDVAQAGSGNVLIGYGTSADPGPRRRRRRRSLPDAASPAPAVASRLSGETPRAVPREAPRVSNPLVRKLARDNGVDVSVVDGSGPDRTVMRADVEAAIAAAAGMAARAADASPEAKDARTGLTVAGRTPLSRTRRTIAEAMEVSRREIPEASVWVDVDVTDLLRLRRDIRPDQDGRRPSLLSFMARLVCVGLARVPELNARLETRADGTPELVTFKGVNLGIAVDSERGLTVPAVQGADKLDARALDAAIAELAGRAREGRASVEELSRGTFTLNNYGVLGVDGSVAIINHPQVAILGLGRIIQRPWVVDGEVAVRDVTELSLTFDHRVCDGGTASRFLRFVADAMQRPGEALVAL